MCASVAAPRNTVVGMASSTGADDKCQFDHAILPVASLGDVKARASGDENSFWLSWSHRVKPPPTTKTDPLKGPRQSVTSGQYTTKPAAKHVKSGVQLHSHPHLQRGHLRRSRPSSCPWRHHPLVLEAHDSRLRVSLISSERLPFPDTCHGFTIRPRYCFPTRVFGTLFVHDGLVRDKTVSSDSSTTDLSSN